MRRTYKPKRDNLYDNRDVLQPVDEKLTAFEACYIKNIKNTKKELPYIKSTKQNTICKKSKPKRRKYVKRVITHIESFFDETVAKTTCLTPDKTIHVKKDFDLFDQLLNSSTSQKVTPKNDLFDQFQYNGTRNSFESSVASSKKRQKQKHNSSSSSTEEFNKENESKNTEGSLKDVTDLRQHELIVEKYIRPLKNEDHSFNNIVNNISLLKHVIREDKDITISPILMTFKKHRLTKNLHTPKGAAPPPTSTPYAQKHCQKSMNNFFPISSNDNKCIESIETDYNEHKRLTDVNADKGIGRKLSFSDLCDNKSNGSGSQNANFDDSPLSYASKSRVTCTFKFDNKHQSKLSENQQDNPKIYCESESNDKIQSSPLKFIDESCDVIYPDTRSNDVSLEDTKLSASRDRADFEPFLGFTNVELSHSTDLQKYNKSSEFNAIACGSENKSNESLISVINANTKVSLNNKSSDESWYDTSANLQPAYKDHEIFCDIMQPRVCIKRLNESSVLRYYKSMSMYESPSSSKSRISNIDESLEKTTNSVAENSIQVSEQQLHISVNIQDKEVIPNTFTDESRLELSNDNSKTYSDNEIEVNTNESNYYMYESDSSSDKEYPDENNDKVYDSFVTTRRRKEVTINDSIIMLLDDSAKISDMDHDNTIIDLGINEPKKEQKIGDVVNDTEIRVIDINNISNNLEYIDTTIGVEDIKEHNSESSCLDEAIKDESINCTAIYELSRFSGIRDESDDNVIDMKPEQFYVNKIAEEEINVIKQNPEIICMDETIGNNNSNCRNSTCPAIREKITDHLNDIEQILKPSFNDKTITDESKKYNAKYRDSIDNNICEDIKDLVNEIEQKSVDSYISKTRDGSNKYSLPCVQSKGSPTRKDCDNFSAISKPTSTSCDNVNRKDLEQMCNNANGTSVRNTLNSFSILENDQHISHTPIVLQPGKKWERSLSIYKRMTVANEQFDLSILDEESLNTKGRNYRQSVINTMEMQEFVKDSLHNESFSSSRTTFVTKPSRSTIKIVKIPNYSEVSLSSTLTNEEPRGFLSEDCDDTLIELSKLSIADADHEVTVLEKVEDTPVRISSALDYVLRRCNQTESILFDECYPATVLKNCHKIGEGVYGEVFLWRASDGARVMKVVPVGGSTRVNGEPQKDFHEIISEIVIAMELSALRAPIALIDKHLDEGNDIDALELHSIENATDTFNEVLAVRCVHGSYPSRLLDLWELFDETRGSENDNPAVLPQDQRYIVLELANAGQDLEGFVFNNAEQAHNLFIQIAYALAVAEEAYQFEHRDLHWGNVLIACTEQKFATFVLRGRTRRVARCGVRASIIDYSLSRVSLPLCAPSPSAPKCGSAASGERVALYNDLATDASLFSAVGDYQFDVYRHMRDKLGNEWKNFEPYTNILWLHYTLDKMITAVNYKRTNTKIHKHYIAKLKGLKNRILEYGSAVQFVLTDNEF